MIYILKLLQIISKMNIINTINMIYKMNIINTINKMKNTDMIYFSRIGYIEYIIFHEFIYNKYNIIGIYITYIMNI